MSRIGVIARPVDADTATLRGAARYGLARRPLVASVIAPRSYIMKVRHSLVHAPATDGVLRSSCLLSLRIGRSALRTSVRTTPVCTSATTGENGTYCVRPDSMAVV